MTSVTLLKNPGAWKNTDGLYVQFPGLGVYASPVGAPWVQGSDNEVIVDLDWKDFPAFQSDTLTGVIYGGTPLFVIPSGAQIITAIVDVDIAFTGTSAVLIVGLVSHAGVIDTLSTGNGLINATDGALASGLNAVGVAKVTGTGGTIGKLTTQQNYIYLTVTGASFTAGHGRLKVKYYMPVTDAPQAVPA